MFKPDTLPTILRAWADWIEKPEPKDEFRLWVWNTEADLENQVLVWVYDDCVAAQNDKEYSYASLTDPRKQKPSPRVKPHELHDYKCRECDGKGWTAEHDPTDPHGDGLRRRSWVRVPCFTCEGTGKNIAVTDLLEAVIKILRTHPHDAKRMLRVLDNAHNAVEKHTGKTWDQIQEMKE